METPFIDLKQNIIPLFKKFYQILDTIVIIGGEK